MKTLKELFNSITRSHEAETEREDYNNEYEADGEPVGCSACGGDYPNCTTSCPLFDD